MSRAGAFRVVGLVALSCCVAFAGCAGPATTTTARTPSASAAADIALPDFNSRLGSNRLAAEAAAQLGRKLSAQGQYWEVYVRTQPAILPATYDPGNPSAAAPARAQVTQTDVILATESAAAIKAFGSGGEGRERAQLGDLDAILHQAFPNLATDTMRIFYGESFQHGAASFDHGKLTQYTVRKLG